MILLIQVQFGAETGDGNVDQCGQHAQDHGSIVHSVHTFLFGFGHPTNPTQVSHDGESEQL